jgi:hypothetical protein
MYVRRSPHAGEWGSSLSPARTSHEVRDPPADFHRTPCLLASRLILLIKSARFTYLVYAVLTNVKPLLDLCGRAGLRSTIGLRLPADGECVAGVGGVEAGEGEAGVHQHPVSRRHGLIQGERRHGVDTVAGFDGQRPVLAGRAHVCHLTQAHRSAPR